MTIVAFDLPSDYMVTFWACVSVCFGLVVGSFLNVVIWRLPRGQKLGKPRSACPGCGALIRWYDNIPVLSWLVLRARCRRCDVKIPIRYPVVEALTGLLFFLAFIEHHPRLESILIVQLALAALLAISYIDWDHKIIPDKITLPGIVAGVVVAPWLALHDQPFLRDAAPWPDAWLRALAGVAVGGGVVWAIRILGGWILKKEAMGFGDVKLLAFIGALVGPAWSLFALVLGCLGGAFIGGLIVAIGKRRPIRLSLRVTGDGIDESFSAAFVRDQVLRVHATDTAEEGANVRLEMVLPAAKVLEDEDAQVNVKGRVRSSRPAGDGHEWQIEVRKAKEIDRERLHFFASSYRYIPFGPFLSLGGALLLLWGAHIAWFIVEGYPRMAQGLFK